jgi:ubiquinone/menaquinone biosynthesis C-methylase UbiE
MDKHAFKMERPERVAELNPTVTLKKAGFKDGDILCDIGAGTGLFAIAAAGITQNTVYAVDINEDVLQVVAEKARKANLGNLVIVKADGFAYAIASETVDYALIATVLHEIENKEDLLAEIKRILTENGKLVVIEFKKRQTPLGPPIPRRIDREEVLALAFEHGFTGADAFDLGENFYCLVLQKK